MNRNSILQPHTDQDLAGTMQEPGSVNHLGITSNPIQTLQAAAQVHGILGSVETEEFGITSNPIQT